MKGWHQICHRTDFVLVQPVPWTFDPRGGDMTEETFSSGPTVEDIKDALSRTGFLLEHRVAQTLRRPPHWNADISQAYPDPETGKSREIDVFASIVRYVSRKPEELAITARLIIECKNNSAPFVLIGNLVKNFPHFDDSVILTFDPLRLRFPKAPLRLAKLELHLDHLAGSIMEDEFTAYQLLRLVRQNKVWKAGNNAIYDSILYPLAKAWSYTIDRVRKDKEEDEKRHGIESWRFPWLYYFFPIVVTSGQLFVLDVSDENLQVSGAKWAKIKRSFYSADLKCDLRADVVSFDHWDEYLESRVVRTIDSAEDTLKKNLNLFDPEWLLANLGEPETKDDFYRWLNSTRKAKG
jgi:hypothetical protein